MRTIDIAFDDVGLPAPGGWECGGGFSGTATIDLASGNIIQIALDTYRIVGTGTERRLEHGPELVGYDLDTKGGNGLARSILYLLAPLIKSRCAASIADAIRSYHASADDRRADYQRETDECMSLSA